MLYLTSGFVFLQVFNFIASNKNPNDYKHVIIKTSIVGYVLTLGYKIVPSVTRNTFIDILLFLILCVIGAYLGAQLYSSKLFRAFCRKLNIRRTTNKFIWLDLEDDHVIWVRAINYQNEMDCLGQLLLVEDFQRFPQLVLTRYIRKDLRGNVIIDMTYNPKERIVIDTAKCDIVELSYTDDLGQDKTIFQTIEGLLHKPAN